jgi:hypothetical protein
LDVVTEADILAVSDGTSFVIAHAGGSYNVVTRELKMLAAVLQVAR